MSTLTPLSLLGLAAVMAIATIGSLLAELLVRFIRSRNDIRDETLSLEWLMTEVKLRRRLAEVTAPGGTATAVARAVFSKGWVWIAFTSQHEAMGWARTRRGAERALATFKETGDPTTVSPVRVRVRKDVTTAQRVRLTQPPSTLDLIRHGIDPDQHMPLGFTNPAWTRTVPDVPDPLLEAAIWADLDAAVEAATTEAAA